MTSSTTRAGEPVAVYLGAGSNLGDRKSNLRAGFDRLRSRPGIELACVASLYETAPVGGPPGQGFYLNTAALVFSALEPTTLLATLHDIEASVGRNRATEERWGPRVLDLDLLAFGDLWSQTAELTLPHPLVYERLFVLEPLMELPHLDGTSLDWDRVSARAEALRADKTQLVRKVEGPSWYAPETG